MCISSWTHLLASTVHCGTTPSCRVLSAIPTKPGRRATRGRLGGDFPPGVGAAGAAHSFSQRLGAAVGVVHAARRATVRSVPPQRRVIGTQPKRSWPPPLVRTCEKGREGRKGRPTSLIACKPGSEIRLRFATMSGASARSLEKGEACPPRAVGLISATPGRGSGGAAPEPSLPEGPLPRGTGSGCSTRDLSRPARGRREAEGPRGSPGHHRLRFSPVGSAPPGPVPEGLIRLYSMRFCPFAQRTRLVLKAKGIR